MRRRRAIEPLKTLLAISAAAVLAALPASAQAPDTDPLVIVPLAYDREARTVTLRLEHLQRLLHLAGRECGGS